VTLGEATGLLGLIRSILLDRATVKVLTRGVNHARGDHRMFYSYTGPWLHIEVHVIGRIPVRVTRVGVELDDGQVVPTTAGDRLPATLSRPESVHLAIEVDSLRKAILAAGAGRHLRRIRVEVSPDHVHHAKLPKGWEQFPEKDPPLVAGDPEGFVAGIF
jgi:hypothetical protein